MIDQQTIHVHDVAAEIETEFPEARVVHQLSGSRTILATPLVREGLSIGAIVIRRQEVRPFSRSRSRFSRLSPTKRSSPLRTCGCLRTAGAQRRIARGVGASDGDVGSARHHQPFADGRAAGPRRHRRERGSGLRD